MRAIERVVLAYITLESAVAVSRLRAIPESGWILLANGLIVLLLWLVHRPGLGRFGRAAAELAPLLVMLASYGALDVLSGHGGITTHEKTVMHWEQTLFGGQVSRTWWQHSPSWFWATLFHGVYVGYYAILAAGPIWFLSQGQYRELRRSIAALAVTYAICYAVFLFFPVAGPNYEFSRPTGVIVDNPTARLAYRLLAQGSSYGAAFPSSHVAAALVASAAAGLGSAWLGTVLAVPSVLLIFAVVYCQMHYAVDSAAGVMVAVVVIGGMLLVEKRR